MLNSLRPIAGLIVASMPVLCQPFKVQTITSKSPDGTFALSYKGDEYGRGTISIVHDNQSKLLHKSQGNHPPEFLWHSNTLASFRIYCGSPCWYAYYYDTFTGKLSPVYDFPLAFNPESGLLAHVSTKDNIVVSDVRTGRLRFAFTPDKADCQEFPFLYSVKFITPYCISIHCGEIEKQFEIPK